MPFDAIFMSCLRKETEERILGLKIDKVQQPDRDLIVLSFKGGKLMISLNSSNGRIQITGESFENPATPPMFCMLLRKHLSGGKIVEIKQPHLERVYDITVETYDALGAFAKKHLIVELMGRYTNLILTDGEMMIVDCVRRIGFDISNKRQVLPGLLYELPPKTGKTDPMSISREEFESMIGSQDDARLDKLIVGLFDGFSPLVSREIVYRAYGTTDVRLSEAGNLGGIGPLADSFFDILSRVENGNTIPYILFDKEGKPYDFSYIEIRQYENMCEGKACSGYSELLSEFYSKRDKIERMRTKTQSIGRNIRRLRDRTVRRLAAQEEELLLTADRDRNRENGDLIMSNLYRMKKGMSEITVDDYYAGEGKTRNIKLDILKTPQQNAAKYYKDYTKAKTAEVHLKEQIKKGETEVDYLESVLDSIEKAETEKDVSEIRQELVEFGYIRQPKNSRKEKKISQRPMHFVSSSGMDIWVGKNNTQNDTLTMKTAFKRDIWLHTQKIHGSHVVISAPDGPADERSLYEAAVIAAYFSQGKNGTNVPVDYTNVRFVKKPAGARPGMVVYTDYNTLYVTPDEKLVSSLKAD